MTFLPSVWLGYPRLGFDHRVGHVGHAAWHQPPRRPLASDALARCRSLSMAERDGGVPHVARCCSWSPQGRLFPGGRPRSDVVISTCPIPPIRLPRHPRA